MFLQLSPPIPLETPKGKAWAIALIDYGPQWDLQWVTFLHEGGECWTFSNRDIRQEENYTFGIKAPSPIQPRTPRPTPIQAPSFMMDHAKQSDEAAPGMNGHANGHSKNGYLPYMSN